MTPSWYLLHPLPGLLFCGTGTQPSPIVPCRSTWTWWRCTVWGVKPVPGCQLPGECDWVFGAVKKYTATSGMFLLWSLWSLTCTCQTCRVFPTGWANQEVSSVIVYHFLVSAASIVPQIPHLRASALLDTQGMGPIAQVCPASVGKIQGLQTPVEATQRQGFCLWNKWHGVAKGKIIQILFVIHHELCHALVEKFSSLELYTGCSWCC